MHGSILAFALIALVLGAWGQERESTAPPLYRAEVDLLSVAVRVTDRNDNEIRGLTADRFKLFEGCSSEDLLLRRGGRTGQPGNPAGFQQQHGFYRQTRSSQTSPGPIGRSASPARRNLLPGVPSKGGQNRRLYQRPAADPPGDCEGPCQTGWHQSL